MIRITRTKSNKPYVPHSLGYQPTTTRYHSASDFATFSATKILINEIMGGITGSKLPFRIIFRA